LQVLNDYEDDNALESPYKKVIKYIIHLASFSGPLAQVQFKSWEGAWARADKVAKTTIRTFGSSFWCFQRVSVLGTDFVVNFYI